MSIELVEVIETAAFGTKKRTCPQIYYTYACHGQRHRLSGDKTHALNETDCLPSARTLSVYPPVNSFKIRFDSFQRIPRGTTGSKNALVIPPHRTE